MLNFFPAEWTKLRSTASFWWTSAIFIVLGALYGALFGWSSRLTGMPYAPLTVVATVALTGAIVIIVQSAMMVTTEYRFGVPATNFRLAPQRWQLALVKALLGAVLAAVVAVIGLVVAFVFGDLTAAVPANWLSNSAAHRALWAVPLGMALVAVFTQGVGWIVRNTAGTIVVGMGMLLLLETIVNMIPKVGPNVGKFLPFGNLLAFMTNQPTQHWTLGVSLAIFVAWALVVWIIGVVLLESRDA